MSPIASVLVIDDNDVDRERIERLLRGRYSVLGVDSGSAGLQSFDRGTFDCVLLDLRLPDCDGLELLPELVRHGAPVMVLTGQGSEHAAVAALKCGAADYLSKSDLSARTLDLAIAGVLEKRRMQAELDRREQELARRLEELEASNRALRENEARLRVVFEQLPVIVWTADASLVVTSVMGESAIVDEAIPPLGRTVRDAIERAKASGGAPDSGALRAVEAHEQALRGEHARFELMLSGSELECCVEPLRDEDGEPCGVVGVAIDVSERRALESHVRQSQKMEALGSLAGGVAHDFNNLLTAIMNFAALGLEATDAETPVHVDLQEILKTTHRGRELVRRLLTFTHADRADPEIVDVDAVATDMERMLRGMLGPRVEFVLRCRAADNRVRIDRVALGECLVNLVVNAGDAMRGSGRLEVAIDRTRLPGDEDVITSLPPGEYVRLRFTDDGPGIPPAIRQRVFDPFFTTKERGEGTGLGLAVSLRMVAKAGGDITLSCPREGGAVFTIYLPRTEEPIAEAPAASQREVVESSCLGTVFVVEDEPQIRKLIVRVLQREGFTAHSADDPELALSLIVERADTIDLVLTDVLMPKMTGPMLVRELRTQIPELPVLFMSGYVGDSDDQELAIPDARLLRKPFTPSELIATVREVLDRR